MARLAAVTSITTMKSGTNQLHGSAFDYFVNEALSAGLPFTDAGSINPAKEGQHIRNPIRQNDYGFTFGGPVTIPRIYNGHDRSFFFFSFEQFSQSNVTENALATVPTASMKNGNLSSVEVASPFTCGGPDPLCQPVCWNELFDPNTRQV
jgi:hypothetical protein